MSTLVLGRNMLAPLYLPTVNAGGSDAGLRKALSEAHSELHRAASSAQSLALTSLMQVLEECSQAGWDGYNARAVPHQAAIFSTTSTTSTNGQESASTVMRLEPILQGSTQRLL